jgi:hypothetical protein
LNPAQKDPAAFPADQVYDGDARSFDMSPSTGCCSFRKIARFTGRPLENVRERANEV